MKGDLRWRRAFVVTAVALSITGCSETASPATRSSPSDAVLPLGIQGVPVTPAPIASAASQPRLPIALTIPRIGVAAAIEAVGEDSTGQMATPSRWDNVAWFEHGYYPGDSGNAVITGHLNTDQHDHPEAVFWHLNELLPDDRVDVVRADGSVLQFEVVQVQTLSSDHFPASTIFGASSTPQLRLVTCAGRWRGARLGYDARLVATARLVAISGGAPNG